MPSTEVVSVRSGTAQSLLRALVRAGGRIEDESGSATRVLGERTDTDSRPWLATVLKSLEEQGYVVRDKGPNPKSRKTFVVEITDSGRRAVEGSEHQEGVEPEGFERGPDSSNRLRGSVELDSKEFDYNQLANRLLKLVLRKLKEEPNGDPKRLEELREQVRDLGDRLNRVARERDQLREVLERREQEAKREGLSQSALSKEDAELVKSLLGGQGA